MLRLDEAFIPKDFSPYVLLAGPGQTGAQNIIKQLEDQFGSFNGKRIRLQGSLRKGDGTMIGELSQGVDALIAIEGSLTYPIQQTAPKSIELKGKLSMQNAGSAGHSTRRWTHRYCSKMHSRDTMLKVVRNGRVLYCSKKFF